jgi:hypothetical protein
MNLSQVLSENGIDIENWSHDRGNKSISDLQTEIEAGEATLETIDGILTRVVKVASVSVNVWLGEKLFLLVEDKQIFFTGAIRERQRKSLSEKLYANETPISAARRVLKEEICLDYLGELISIGEEVQQQNSPSYPGLNSIYQIFNYQIFLTAADLQALRFAEIQADKISLFTLEQV